MEINKNNYEDLISSLSKEARIYFYETLAHNLTVVCRVIWSSETLSDRDKIEQMKWLNEIQHRIVSKIKVVRLALHEWKEADIIAMIEGYVKQSPGIGPEVAWAIKSSYKITLEKTS